MKSLFMALFVFLIVSCNSDDDDGFGKDYKAENEQEIQAYIAANNLDATRSSSGLYYVVDVEGDGAAISSVSDVSVRYKGFYTDDTLLEENTEGVSFNLQQVIPGWQEGLQYFNEGGSGMLLIPSHLAYGSEDFNGIPGGSVLIFEIEVIDYDVENEEEIVKYIEDNNLDATASGTGLYYVIEEEGTGEQPEADSRRLGHTLKQGRHKGDLQIRFFSAFSGSVSLVIVDEVTSPCICPGFRTRDPCPLPLERVLNRSKVKGL